MKTTISFRNLEHTTALDEKIQKKSEKLKKYLTNQAEVHWVCWIEDSSQYAEVKVHDGKQNFLAKAHSKDLYQTMDIVIDKISNQIAHQH